MYFNEQGYIIDLDYERVVKALETGNKNLDSVTTKYFASKISKPHLGEDYFKYVEDYFNTMLREYSIVDSRVIHCLENPTQSKLLELNNIPNDLFQQYKKKVNELLQSYTDSNWDIDKKRKILLQQLFNILDSEYTTDKEIIFSKIINKLKNSNFVRIQYLDSVILQMQNGGINQILNNEYIVVNKLFKSYFYLYSDNFIKHWKNKKDYLVKQNIENGSKKLQEYLIKIYFDHKEIDEDFNIDIIMDEIRFFVYYLIYGSSKIDLYVIHSILGYKYKEGVILYQKLFLKDHTTGKKDDFLVHTDIFNFYYANVFAQPEVIQNYIKLLNPSITLLNTHKITPKAYKEYLYDEICNKRFCENIMEHLKNT